MQSNFAAAVALVLKSEGGFVDNPVDPGGATNLGITRKTLAAWRGVSPWWKLPTSAVKALTAAEATTIYKANYWQPVAGDDLPAGLDYAVFDYGVNSGPGKAARDLQEVLGVTVDGRIGPETVAAANAAGAQATIIKLCDARLAYVRGLPEAATFGAGWAKRIASVRSAAMAMAIGAVVPAPAAPPAAAYIQPAPVAATHAVVKQGLKAAGSVTINAADMQTKIVGTATAGTVLIGAVNTFTAALASVPPWVWMVAAIVVLGAVLYFTNRIVRARVDAAITGVNTELPLVRPQIEAAPPPQAIVVADDPPQPEGDDAAAQPAAPSVVAQVFNSPTPAAGAAP